MNRLVATSVAFAAMTGGAFGADLGPAPLPWTWTGPYIGLNAGFGWSNNEEVNCVTKDKVRKKKDGGHKIKTASAGPGGGTGTGVFIVDGKIVQSSEAEAGPEGAQATAETNNSHSGGSSNSSEVSSACRSAAAANHSANGDSSGFVGGAQLGYNLQFSRVVLGIEGDISFVDWEETDAFGTVRGRLGYAWERVLPYVTGGLAVVDSDTGWTAGAGVEVAVSDNVSLRGEYLHFDVTDFEGDIVRAGINFRFWRPQPEPVYVAY